MTTQERRIVTRDSLLAALQIAGVDPVTGTCTLDDHHGVPFVHALWAALSTEEPAAPSPDPKDLFSAAEFDDPESPWYDDSPWVPADDPARLSDAEVGGTET